jgi:SAM-dependent methyltransferase
VVDDGEPPVDLREVPQHAFSRHPWELARARFFGQLVSARASAAPITVLDVGAGDGFLARSLLKKLPPGSEVTCLDSNYTDEQLASLGAKVDAGADRGLRFTRQRPDRRFDVLLLLDVVEHVAEDRRFLSDMVAGSLVSGGLAVVSVPAMMSLYSQHDVALGHYRRYRLGELRALLGEAGLEVEQSSGIFHSLIAPRALAKGLEVARGIRSRPSSDGPPAHADTELGDWRGGKALTAVVSAALRLDNQLSRLTAAAGIPLPGLSVWAVGRKP